MICWYSKLFGISTIPNKVSLQIKEQDSQEKCPLHLDWEQSIQTWPRSNLKKVCKGRGSLWHPFDLSWWALWRSLCSKKDNIQSVASRLLLAYSSSGCEKSILVSVISARGWESLLQEMKCPYNLKWLSSHLTSGSWTSLGILTLLQSKNNKLLCALIIWLSGLKPRWLRHQQKRRWLSS